MCTAMTIRICELSCTLLFRFYSLYMYMAIYLIYIYMYIYIYIYIYTYIHYTTVVKSHENKIIHMI